MASAALRPARRKPGIGRRIIGWLWKAAAIFVVASIALVLLYRFVNPPMTLTMIGDMMAGHGATRSWRSLDAIDRD
ncbi:hypothetical protein NL449_28210, partial [Klebsiella pneumoniae]|nr:hypothetical protein [Klebsiella pneumoniae]